MTESRDHTASRPLASLGITDAEEQAYRALLAHPGATARDLTGPAAMPQRTVQRLLDALEAKGLATHSPQRPRRYLPTPPDIALEGLIVQRHEELQRARGAIEELQELAKTDRAEEGSEHVVELITSREAERQTLEHLVRAAQHEVLSMVRPPVRVSRLDIPREQDQRLQRQARDRGVRFRTVVDAGFLEVPGTAAAVQADIEAGEEVRSVSELPVKLVLIDRRVGIIPLDLQQADSPALLVRSSPLLDALHLLYEVLWDRAAPMSVRAGGLDTAPATGRLPATTDDLVRLLAAGLNDKVIARELGVSVRTLERRIADLMGALDARTRFQVGWLAAQRLS